MKAFLELPQEKLETLVDKDRDRVDDYVMDQDDKQAIKKERKAKIKNIGKAFLNPHPIQNS